MVRIDRAHVILISAGAAFYAGIAIWKPPFAIHSGRRGNVFRERRGLANDRPALPSWGVFLNNVLRRAKLEAYASTCRRI